MRLDAGVYAYVHVECYTLVKRFGAVGAFVLLFIAMDLHVTAKVAFVVKCFTAFRTFGGELLRTAVHRQVILVIAKL